MSQQLPDAAAELLKTPLTVQQRVELIGELWDSIPDSIDSLPIPEWHREELEKRLAAADANPEAEADVLPRVIGMSSNNLAWELHSRMR